MGEPLKHLFGKDVPRRIAKMIQAAWPAFRARAFVADACAGLEDLELTPRARHVARALERHLPRHFPTAAGVLVRSLGPRLGQRGALTGMASFLYLPHAFFVAAHGGEHLEEALQAQYEITQRFTAEYSIRTFLERHPRETLARLAVWATDRSVHVRRLVSEGTRPRLPWAPRLPAFQKDPSPVLRLLEALKDDPDLYVRRSVANNLNDIGKDHPDLLLAVCARWRRGATAERRWLIRHALRSVVKGGNPKALGLLGFGAAPRVSIAKATFTPATVRIGQSVALTVELASRAAARQKLLVDFRVHFVKADGQTRAKVFKMATLTMAPRARVVLRRSVSLRVLTTRKPYPGSHRVELLVNGKLFPAGAFRVVG